MKVFMAVALFAGVQAACVAGSLKTRILQTPYAAGISCNVFWLDDPAEAKRFFEMGIDTILTNDYLPISEVAGIK